MRDQIDELMERLKAIKGNDPVSRRRRVAIQMQILELMKQAEG